MNAHLIRLVFLFFMIITSSCLKEQDAKQVELTAIEKYRPQFHFTPEAHWMNDPNGLVYYEGEYHLFYQYYPDSTVWGPMHWGHAVSEDLIHWDHLPVALYPDDLGYIFSGSAVVDWNNSSGLGTKENPPIVAIFTYHDPEGEKSGAINYQTQGLAFSTDNGRTWTKYENNPIIQNPGIRDFRDPKVSWSKDYQKWIMALAVLDHISFYSSTDLINWKFESDFGKDIGAHGGVWECPDLFKLQVKDTEEEKWVLFVSINPGAPNGGSGTQYFVGDFDGSKFILDDSFTPAMGESIWIDYGTDNYAGVTWSDIPEVDGRRIFIGWMSNWQYANLVPTESWRSAMTVPRSLELSFKEGQYFLVSNPVKELQAIEGSLIKIDPQEIEGSTIIKTNLNTYKLDLNLNSQQVTGFELVFSNDLNHKVNFGISKEDSRAYFDRSKSGVVNFEEGFINRHYGPYNLGESISLKILVDVASMEIFLDNGEFVMTEILFPEEGYDNIEIVSKDGKLEVVSGSITGLHSIWDGAMPN